MSVRRSIQVTCSECNKSQSVAIYDSICVSLCSGQKEKERIKRLEFFTHTCDFCGSKTELAYPSLYHDTTKQLMLWLLPIGSPDEQKILDNILKTNIPNDYTTRLVGSAIELADKIAIFDANLDDRIIEICKILLFGDLCENDSKYEEYDIRHATYHKNHGIQHTIMYHYEYRGLQSSFAVALEQNYYNAVEKAFSKILKEFPFRKYEEINTNWAYTIIDMFQKER